MNQFAGRRSPQAEGTKDKGAGVVSDYLFSMFPLLADHLDGLKLQLAW
jgi:hypothetical protein